MRAKNIKITVLNAASLELEEDRLGLKGSPTQVVKIFSPERRKGGEIFSGSAEEAVHKLTAFLKQGVQ